MAAVPPAIPPPAFSGMVSDENVPISQDYSPSIMALNGSQFRGGYADLVTSPSLPTQKFQEMAKMMSPQEMLPAGNMDAQGVRYNSDGSIPNQGNIASIALQKNAHSNDCVTAAFAPGPDILPLKELLTDFSNNIFATQPSIFSGTEYERALMHARQQRGVDGGIDMATRRLELFYV